MPTHTVSSLDSGHLLQCVGILSLAFAGITSFDLFYWFTYTTPLALIGTILLLAPYSSKFRDIMQAFETGKKSVPSGPNHREKKAERKAERKKEKKAARESSVIQRTMGRPSDAQIELIKKEQERRQKIARPRSYSILGRDEMS